MSLYPSDSDYFGQPDMVSKYFKQAIINHVLRSASVSGSELYIGLYHKIRNPNNTDIFYMEEISGSGYSRLNVTGSWLVNATTGSITNSTLFSFPTATEDYNVRPGYIALLNEQSSSASYLIFSEISSSPVVKRGESLIINPEKISIKLSEIYSIYLSEMICEHYLNNSVIYYTPGSSIFFALYSASPSLADTGGTEISASAGYSRVQVDVSGCWVDPTSGSTANTQDILFSDSVSESWGKLRYLGIRDHPTAGHLLFLSQIYPPVAVINPDGFKFPPFYVTVKPHVSKDSPQLPILG